MPPRVHRFTDIDEMVAFRLAEFFARSRKINASTDEIFQFQWGNFRTVLFVIHSNDP